MVRKNRSAPEATVVPVLIYEDVERALSWLCDTFGFEERLRFVGRAGAVEHAQIDVADGAIMIGRTGGPFRPPRDGEVAQYVHVTVPDVDAHYERARAAGATLLDELWTCRSGSASTRCPISKAIGGLSPSTSPMCRRRTGERSDEVLMSEASGTAPAHHDLRLRNATVADLDSLVRLHVQTFNETHGPGPSVEVREQQWRKAFSEADPEWFCVVAETSERRLVGFAKGQPYTEEELGEFRGELNKIYVLREYQKRGLGRRLVCAAAQGLLTRGIKAMLLFGDARSPSNGFYERMGAERLITANGDFHGGYGWRDLKELVKHCPE